MQTEYRARMDADAAFDQEYEKYKQTLRDQAISEQQAEELKEKQHRATLQKRWRTLDLKRTTSAARKWDHLKDSQHCHLVVDPRGNHRWYHNSTGRLHRVDENGVQDGPAMYGVSPGENWHLNGKQHRLGGPASIWGDKNGTQHYYIEGEWVPLTAMTARQTQEEAEQFLKQI